MRQFTFNGIKLKGRKWKTSLLWKHLCPVKKPSQVKVHRPRNGKPPRQLVAGNEAPREESYQLSCVPAPDEATKLTETEQPGSGTTVHRARIEEEKSLSELELGKAKSPLNNVLSDASVRKEASTTGEEVYGADECPVEKRPSRNVRMPKKYADYHVETVDSPARDSVYF